MALSKGRDTGVKAASKFGERHVQCFAIFCGLLLTYAMRVSLSVAILAMTDKKSTGQDFPEYAWSEKLKGTILSSFFWGYIVTQVPGGYLAQRYGGKFVILVGISISSFAALLMPLCVDIGGWQLFTALRVIQGLSQGLIYPALNTLLSQWAPKEERTLLCTCSRLGSDFGNAIMTAASGHIASSKFGWPGIFYISGALGVVWSFIWLLYGANSPKECKRITLTEKNLIEASLSQESMCIDHDRILKTPWMKFLSSTPFWALLITHCCCSWGYWTVLTQTPTYMNKILGLNVKDSALLTSVSYSVGLPMSFVFLATAIYVNKKKWLTLTANRKTFNTIACWVPALVLTGIGFVGAEQTNLAVTLFIISVGANTSEDEGFHMNHLDLSPNFAGILMGVTNTMATIMAISAPLFKGFIVTDAKNPCQWRIVFCVAGGSYFVGNLIFLVFGTAEVQPWNSPAPKTSRESNGQKNLEKEESEICAHQTQKEILKTSNLE